MDLKLYYQKIRDKESEITDAFPIVVSNETADGGKPGLLTEVTPGIAAKMLVEGVARLAAAEEAQAFKAAQAEARRVAEQAAAAAKVQFTVLSTAELNRLQGPHCPPRTRRTNMALFIDGPASSMEDLAAQDSQLLDVASVENIDVTQKLALAQDELTLELNAL